MSRPHRAHVRGSAISHVCLAPRPRLSTRPSAASLSNWAVTVRAASCAHLVRLFRVDLRDEPVHVARTGPQRDEHLLLAFGAMREVLVELRVRVQHDRTVSGMDRRRVEIEHPSQRRQVLREVAVGRIDEAGAAPEDRVPGEEGARSAIEEHHVVGAVTGRVHGRQLDAGGPERLPVLQALRAVEPPRPHRCADPFGQRARSLAVVLVVVGDEDVRDVARRAADLVQVGRDRGTRIDHDRRAVADDPRVRSLERVDARVRREDPDDADHAPTPAPSRGWASRPSPRGRAPAW